MILNKCKKCRRAGDKLFLKGEKCSSPKCAIVRKPYAPGFFGKAGCKNRKGLSEYGLQMRKKQQVKFTYGLREKQFENYVEKATKTKGDNAGNLFGYLENRLDNVLFRCGFVESRTMARQAVLHGHVSVNGKRVNIPSYQVSVGEKVTIRPQSLVRVMFKNIEINLKKYSAPLWIKLDKDKKEAEIIGKPGMEEYGGLRNDLNTIIEFYSR